LSNLITNSRKACFQLCPQLERYTYELGYRPLAKEEPLAFGTCFHAALDAWWKAHGTGTPAAALASAQAAISGHAGDLDPAAVIKARVLMDGYDARWTSSMEDLEVLAVELEFRAPLRSPNGRAFRGIRIAGKIDKVIRRRSTGEVWNVEHKTSGADLTAGSAYWQKLRMDSQVSMYFDGAKAHGYDLAGCIYDVIAKPEQRPYKATAPDARKFTKDGKLYASQREVDESLDEFRARLTNIVAEAPESYFQRADVIRLDTELAAARKDVYEVARLMRMARTAGLSPRNPAACHAFGRPCSFLTICEGSGTLDDDTRFKRLQFPHPELDNNPKEKGTP
jgi:hypothetical protein